VSQLELERVSSPRLRNFSARFGPGIHVLLGAESDGTADMIELCAGVRLPQRGQLKLDGQVPGSSPQTRRRIASLLAVEGWVGEGDVQHWIGHLGALHGFDAAAATRRFCPELALGRAVRSLSGPQRRALSLAAALAQPEPQLVALHEPLAAAAASAGTAVLERLRQLSERTPVLLATRSVSDARRLGGQLRVLERGVLVRESSDAWPPAVTPGLAVELTVECAEPRRLLAELAGAPEVERVSFDQRQASSVRVSGNDLERLALAVSRAALAARVELRMLRAGTPDLEAVHGASAGLAQAAYRAAQTVRRGGT
jgi:ABC-type multidrug transport system ATPase subunit